MKMSEKKTLVMMYGYPATGKTTFSRKLKSHLEKKYRVKILSTLEVREELNLFDLESDVQRDVVYHSLSKKLEDTLKEDYEILILDGNFNEKKRREMFYEKMGGAELYIIHCFVSDEEIIEERMKKRKENTGLLENKAANMDLYRLIKLSGNDFRNDEVVIKGLAKVIEFDSGENKIMYLSQNRDDFLLKDILSMME